MSRPDHWPPPVYDVPLVQAMRDIGAGLRPWPKDPNKKRHHFVPRFILAEFATGSDESSRVIQLDKTTGAMQRVRPDEAASRRRFYAVESDESSRDNRIEDFMALIENYATDPVRTLISSPGEITEADRTTISLLLALQERRTPYGIAEAGAAAEQIGRAGLAAFAADEKTFATMWRERHPHATSEEIEDARREVQAIATEGRLHLDNQREQGMLIMLQGLLPLAEAIDNMDWRLLRPVGRQEFCANDQGVARLDTSTTFSAPHVSPQWLFPLAPRACLLVMAGDRTLSERGSTELGTRDINLRVYGWAERFVFARSQHVLSETRRYAKADPRRAAGPPRVRPPRARP